jgi:hypothetical protein
MYVRTGLVGLLIVSPRARIYSVSWSGNVVGILLFNALF